MSTVAAPPLLLTPLEQRRARRPRVLLTGKVVHGAAWLTVDCTIRDLTEDGARLRLSGPAALSAPLVLIEVGSGRAHECEVTWRRLPEVGVKFLRSDDLRASSRPELGRIRRIWLDSGSR